MYSKLHTGIFIILIGLIISCCNVSYASQIKPSLSYAVGQMMMVGFDGTEINDDSSIVKEIKDFHIGGVIILTDYEKNGKNYVRNIDNPQQLEKLITSLQAYAKKYNDLPLFIAINQEGGLINELGYAKGLYLQKNSSQAHLGQLRNSQLIYEQAYGQGKILKTLGFNLNLAPVADLNINPNNPAVGALQRSFGKDASQVSSDLKTTIQAYKTAGVLCTLKHFPGLGSASSNTDYAVTDVSTTWHPDELQPYENLINAGNDCDFIMVTPLINRQLDPAGLPASLSRDIVTNLLRHKLHYRGLVITDDMDAKAIRQFTTVENAITMAVVAGNNIILYGGTQGYDSVQDATILQHTLYTMAQNNPKIKEKVFQSYQKITALKAGFFR